MFDNKTVLVTGGTGSFGKRFIRRLVSHYRPKRLIVYSRDELKQYELSQRFSGPEYECMRYFLGDVRDYQRLLLAFRGVDLVVHAAALKQVPAAEYNPFEFVKTNVIGAQNVITAAIERGVETVVALSTDKASNPINLYGATKLCADKLFVAGNSYSGEGGTKFSVVRYGNVVGSRGSVIPLFMNAKASGVLPITDERMTRFWLTLDQAIDLVVTAARGTRGGEIFVPKIPSMRIVDLAKAIAPECRFDITGIRPGEKLHESMIGTDDAPYTLDYGDHYVIQSAIHHRHLAPEGLAPGITRVPNGFHYSSDTNEVWLDAASLRQMLSHYQLHGQELVELERGDG